MLPTSPTPSLMPLQLWQNLDDVEETASKVLSARAYTYFHSAADSLNSVLTNRLDWARISFRPRVLRNVAQVDMGRQIMGRRSALPIFIAPAALAKLAHKDGEAGIASGAAEFDIPYCVSSYSSCSLEDIISSAGQENAAKTLIYQLYVPKTKLETEQRIRRARELGFTALVITVDTPVVGKREEDERHKADLDYKAGVVLKRTPKISPGGSKPILRGAHSSTLDWDDLAWIRKTWAGAGPIILKGIQSAEDALKAYQMKVDGIYLSNHGGRQLDFAPSSIRTLLEIRKFCPDIIGKIDIYLDGGVRRGTDIVKAICLGATAVGIGRPFLYALGCYGTEGVVQTIQRRSLA
jgi:L-lactate dehydrogenase (cytochrome)